LEWAADHGPPSKGMTDHHPQLKGVIGHPKG